MTVFVRVHPGTTVHRCGDRPPLAADHPMYDWPCPVCGGPLADRPITLVYVGRDPVHPSRWTASAVVVHEACAGPHGESAAEMQANGRVALAAATEAADRLEKVAPPEVVELFRTMIAAFREVIDPTREPAAPVKADDRGPEQVPGRGGP